jgi:hypothetical protein
MSEVRELNDVVAEHVVTEILSPYGVIIATNKVLAEVGVPNLKYLRLAFGRLCFGNEKEITKSQATEWITAYVTKQLTAGE